MGIIEGFVISSSFLGQIIIESDSLLAIKRLSLHKEDFLGVWLFSF